jgi:hypothetical protein
MGSSIRNNRDQRINTRTYRDRRDNTNGGPTQRTYDSRFTAHSSNRYPPALTGEPSSTDHKIDHVHEVTRDQLAPRIQTLSANAVLSDRREFLYYRRKRTGRRCSCYYQESSPDNGCPICIGTGIVGGYEKYGTITEVLDYTHPDLITVNVEPNFDEDTRPVYMRLKEGCSRGYMEAKIDIRHNIGLVENFMLFQPIYNRGTRIIAIDPFGSWAVITEKEHLVPFLDKDWIRLRIEFEAGDERPLISHFLLRYQIRDSLVVYGDIPRAEEDFVGIETGVFEAYQEIAIFFAAKPVTRFRNEDVLYRCRDGRMFKLVVVNENVVAGVLTSTDVRARYVIPDIDTGIAKNLLI